MDLSIEELREVKTKLFEDDRRRVVKRTHLLGESIIDIYVIDDITEPADYAPELKAINEANKNDVIRLHINSCGGVLATIISLINAIRRTKAKVIAICDVAMSVASMLTLACDEIWYSNYTEFMIHGISSGVYGNTRDNKNIQIHYDKYFRQLLLLSYEGFLTEAEVEKFILDGTDLYLVGYELQEKFKKWTKYHNKLIVKT